jgi:dihydropteroate synthase
MGILNVTPDSFHDGGRYFDPERAVDRGFAMVEEGADLIDVGGDSASGEAAEIDAAEEIRRIEPVVRALASRVPVPVAVDTHRSETADAALDAGASLVNDITGLADPRMARVIAKGNAGVCVMHIKGVPKQFPPDWHYRNVMGDILRFLAARTGSALAAGIAPERICVDPGIEFGKLIGQDLEILRRLDELHALGFPILLAASRKTLIGNVLGRLPSSERLEGTAAVNTYAIARGARIIRVHDVRAMARVARMTEALIGMAIDGSPMERCRADGIIVDEAALLPPAD